MCFENYSKGLFFGKKKYEKAETNTPKYAYVLVLACQNLESSVAIKPPPLQFGSKEFRATQFPVLPSP